MNVDALPKVELHLHLDCSLSYDVVRELDPGITEEQYRQRFIAPAKCRDLADYLTRALAAVALLQDERALRLATWDLFRQLQADNVIYAEIRFAPLLHTAGGLAPTRVVEVVEATARQASAETGVEARLILCTLRHFSGEQSMETVRLVDAFEGSLVAAFDLAGDEAGYPLSPHIPAFHHAAERGLPFTTHAGEGAGAESVWETLHVTGTRRIGHGVRSIEDPALLSHLVATGIHLEVNPSSNVQTNVCETLAEHPLPRLLDAGVLVSINTDCRTITDVTLDEEYRRVADAFGWGRRQLLRCNLNAVESAFLADEQREVLRRALTDAWTVGG
ncbi:MAG TPA: adenosine deaminase [Chloroflexota bacterium]|nr:adenosine deaminase [Chloroflexota bacterium]